MKKLVKQGFFVLFFLLVWNRITQEILKPSPLKSGKIRWWIELSLFPSKEREEIKKIINDTLNSPFGWAACGLKFEYTDKKYFANVKIFIQNSRYSNYKKTVAVTLSLFFLPKTAIVKVMSPDMFNNPSEFFITLNHEIGHCLPHLLHMYTDPDFKTHSGNPHDLMYKQIEKNQNVMPSSELINKLRLQVMNLTQKIAFSKAILNYTNKIPLFIGRGYKYIYL